MNDAVKLGKKVFTFMVVALTIAWSMGLPALSLNVANAVSCPTLEAGDLVKAKGYSAVYLLNANKERLYFPHADVYKSWYKDYSGIVEVDASCLEAYPAPKVAPYGVNFRPGSKLVKLPGPFPTVYAVEPGNKLAKITSWDNLLALGYTKTDIKDVADSFWPNYSTTGVDITEAVPYEGMLVKATGSSAVYLVKDGKKVSVDGTLITPTDVKTVTQAILDKVPAGTGTVTAASVYDNPTQGTGTTPPPNQTPVGGNLIVALAADTPAARTVADGTIYNDVLKVNLSSGTTVVNVKGITLTKTGLIAAGATKLAGASVWDSKGNRHGDVMTSFTTDGKVTIGFATNPITVAAGTTETLLVKIDLGSAAESSLVGMRVAAAADVTTDGTVGGTFPIEGNQLSVVDGSSALGRVAISSSSIGGITNGTETTATGNLDIGQTQKEIGKFKFTEESSGGLEDITLERIVFYLEGTSQDKDLKNFKVYAPDGTILGSAGSAVDRYVTVKFDSPYTIKKANNRTLSLKADVMDGSGRYFRVHIQNVTDMMVKGASTGYYLQPVFTSNATFLDTFTTNDWFRMKSGSLSIARNSSSPSGTVSAGASSIVLAKYDLTANGEDLELRKMDLTMTKTGTYNLSGNVIVRDATTGDTYLTITGSSANTGGQVNLSTYISLKSGVTKTIEVVGSIDSNATTETYTAYIGNFYGKRMSTLDYANNLGAATANQAGNTLNVSTLSVTFVKDTSMGNKTVATGNSQVIGQYVVRAGSAEPLKLTNLSVEFAGLNAMNVPSMLQNLQLWSGSTQLGTTISTVASSSNSFTFELPLAASESKTLSIKGTFTSTGSGTVSSTITTYNYTGTGSSGNSSSGSNVGGQNITVGSANVVLSAVTDSSSIARIYSTSATPVQVGKWKLEAQNEAVTLKKIKFTVRDDSFATDTSAGNFGELTLYDGSNMTTPLGTATYVPGSGNGYVQFIGMGLTVPADSYKFLVLKSKINSSGTLNVSSTNVFVVTTDTSTDLEITSASGSTLAYDQIDATAGDNTYNVAFATSTYYMFQDAYPTISAVSISSLAIGANTPIFKFTLKNDGTRDLRVNTTTVTMTVTGLLANSTTYVTGTIGAWKLWEANDQGGLGTQLAASTSLGIAGGVNGATSAGYADGGYTTSNSLNVEFGNGNDVNSMMDAFLIAPGSTRTLIVTADTSNIGLGKGSTAFTVQVSGKITGTTGWTTNHWNTGNIWYYYTPVAGSENSTAYRFSDSFDILGNVISASF